MLPPSIRRRPILRAIRHPEYVTVVVQRPDADAFELTGSLSTSVTVVRPDVRELGRLGVELLLQRMDGWPEPPQKVVLSTELVERGSGELAPGK